MMTLPMVSAALLPAAFEEMVGLAHFQILEEDLVEFVVVVLAGVHQDMVAMLVERCHHPRQADDFWPGADHGHDFQFFHGFTGRA